MNIRHLHIFTTICDENSVSHAARKLFMTQPAVSHVLKEIENELGYPLFDRIAKRLYLTQAGVLFLDKARQIVSLHAELEKEASTYEKSAPIRIGSCITIANYWLPEILRAFQQKTNTQAMVNVDSADQIILQLQRNEIDIAFIEGVIPQGDFIAHPFSSYSMRLVCAIDHPCASAHYQRIDELKKESFLLREKGSAIRDSFDSYLRLSQFEITPVWTSANSQALLMATKQGLGITVLPQMLVEKDIEEKTLIDVPLQDFSLKNTNYILYHREKYLSKNMRLLLELMK